MIQRKGDLVIQILPNVKQETIKPYIASTILRGTKIYTDEYAIYSNLEEMGFMRYM